MFRHTFIPGHLLIMLTCLLFACSKKEKPNEPAAKALVIESLAMNPVRIFRTQEVKFKPKLSDSTGTINYQWRLFVDGKEQIIVGMFNGKPTLVLTPQQVAEYTVRLTVTRGSEKSEAEIKFTPVLASIHMGVWGDSEETVKANELKTGNTPFDNLIWLPEVPDERNFKTVLYMRTVGRYEAYHFKENRLFAGTILLSDVYSGRTDDAQHSYTQFLNQINNYKMLGYDLSVQKTWTASPEQIAQYDLNDLSRGEALGLGYLQVAGSGSSALRGKVHVSIHKSSVNHIDVRYILVGP